MLTPLAQFCLLPVVEEENSFWPFTEFTELYSTMSMSNTAWHLPHSAMADIGSVHISTSSCCSLKQFHLLLSYEFHPGRPQQGTVGSQWAMKVGSVSRLACDFLDFATIHLKKDGQAFWGEMRCCAPDPHLWPSQGPLSDSKRAPKERKLNVHVESLKPVVARSQLTKFERETNYGELNKIKKARVSAHSGWQTQCLEKWLKGVALGRQKFSVLCNSNPSATRHNH